MAFGAHGLGGLGHSARAGHRVRGGLSGRIAAIVAAAIVVAVAAGPPLGVGLLALLLELLEVRVDLGEEALQLRMRTLLGGKLAVVGDDAAELGGDGGRRLRVLRDVKHEVLHDDRRVAAGRVVLVVAVKVALQEVDALDDLLEGLVAAGDVLLHLADAAHDDLDELVDVDVGGGNGLVDVVADRVHLVEDDKDELLVAGGEAVVDVDLLEVDLGEVGQGGEGHAGALGEEAVLQRGLVPQRLLVGHEVLAGDDHGVDDVALLRRGEDLAELGHDLGRNLRVGLGRRHVGLDPGAGGRRREPRGEVGRDEARAELLPERVHVAAEVLLGGGE